jgi:hypothetical protein
MSSRPLARKPFKDEVIVTHKEKGKPALKSLVFLKASIDDDRERGAIASKLLSKALEVLPREEGVPASQVNGLPPALKKQFPADLEREAAARRLPPGVHSITCGTPKARKRYFFMLAGALPGANGHAAAAHPAHPVHAPASEPPRAPAMPPAGFGPAFAEAFDRLDRQDGGRNFLKLLELRRALPQFGRAGFDAGLNQLRRERAFSLAPHEGLEGALTPEEREAGISEAGNLWTYALRVSK